MAFRAAPLVASCLLTLACKEPAKPDAAGGAEASIEAPVCSVESMASELDDYCGFNPQVPINELPMVRWITSPPSLTSAWIVRVDSEGVHEPGEPVKSIAAWVSNPGEPLTGEHAGDLTLAIAADIPALDAADLLARLHAAGRSSIKVLVRSEHADAQLPVPRDPKLLDQLAATMPTTPSEQAVLLATKMRAKADECAALSDALAGLATVPIEERCAATAKRVAEAMATCECRAADEVLTLIYAILVGTTAPAGALALVPVEIDPAAAVQPATTATWGEIASHQFASDATHRLWISDTPAAVD